MEADHIVMPIMPNVILGLGPSTGLLELTAWVRAIAAAQRMPPA
jgi:hypothetical protein